MVKTILKIINIIILLFNIIAIYGLYTIYNLIINAIQTISSPVAGIFENIISLFS